MVAAMTLGTGNMKTLIACYGSLKKGFYNHTALGGAAFLGNASVKGVMYLHGSYPRLYHSDGYGGPFNEDLQREHDVEVYSVDQDYYEDIRAMELGAGYVEEEINTSFGVAKIYFNPINVFSPNIDKWIPAYTRELLNN